MNNIEDNNIVSIDIKKIYPHPDNPRKNLGDLTELAESIRKNGVMRRRRNMSEMKLLPCPFCGEEAEIYRMEHLREWSVGCGNIDCTMHPETEGYEECEEAIKAWNTRRPMERIVEELEAERDVSDQYAEGIFDERASGEFAAYSKAIEIVKEGGALCRKK